MRDMCARAMHSSIWGMIKRREVVSQREFQVKVKEAEVKQLLGLIVDSDLHVIPLSMPTMVKCVIGGPRWQVSTGVGCREATGS